MASLGCNRCRGGQSRRHNARTGEERDNLGGAFWFSRGGGRGTGAADDGGVDGSESSAGGDGIGPGGLSLERRSGYGEAMAVKARARRGLGRNYRANGKAEGSGGRSEAMGRRSVSGDGGAAGAGFLKVYSKKDADGPRMALIITDL